MVALKVMKRKLPNFTGALALFMAAFMLCVLPLLYHDALFDINRFKVAAVQIISPAVCMLTLAEWWFCDRKPPLSVCTPDFMAPFLAIILLAVSCVISCALRDFEHAVLYGDEGRYCGLWFMLSCIGAFFVIALWLPKNNALYAAFMVCSSLCALLGFANMAGIDPLGFYPQMKAEQRQIFLSTIGHVDFFGTFLAMAFAFAGGHALFSPNYRMRMLATVCSVTIALGVAASRTDSAVISVSLACAVLFGLSGDNLVRMAKALILSGMSALTLLAMYFVVETKSIDIELSGIPLMLCESGIAMLLGFVLIMFGVLCIWLDRRGKHAPGKCKTSFFVALTLALVLALLIGGIIYFTCINTKADLGRMEAILRFNDEWGTLRGFVYKRALRAFADFTPLQKLFGGGMELTERILTPYFDDPSMLRGGVFNDTHCQPLQMLVTCGLTGAASFLGFYIAIFSLLLRRTGDDPVLCGALAMQSAYLIIMLINVTQPILIATYFSICALAVARLR